MAKLRNKTLQLSVADGVHTKPEGLFIERLWMDLGLQEIPQIILYQESRYFLQRRQFGADGSVRSWDYYDSRGRLFSLHNT